VNAPSRAGNGTYEGVASNYLSQKPEGEVIYGFVRDTGSAFRLPQNPATPLIMVGPGTGLAPFRGFLQERAALKAEGKEAGKSLLFFGCRHPETDYIYREELEEFEREGVTTLFTACSRVEGQLKTYVQHQIKEHQDEVWQLLQEGAVVYICGDATRMAPDVRRTFAAIYREKTGADEQAAEQWLNELTNQKRYLVDVWAAS
jgi:cytochrome P450/NADPH-cytochrome P450 reductase